MLMGTVRNNSTGYRCQPITKHRSTQSTAATDRQHAGYALGIQLIDECIQ